MWPLALLCLTLALARGAPVPAAYTCSPAPCAAKPVDLSGVVAVTTVSGVDSRSGTTFRFPVRKKGEYWCRP